MTAPRSTSPIGAHRQLRPTRRNGGRLSPSLLGRSPYLSFPQLGQVVRQDIADLHQTVRRSLHVVGRVHGQQRRSEPWAIPGQVIAAIGGGGRT